MTSHAKGFFNGWTLKDIVILGSILGYAIHGESKTVDVGQSAESAVHEGVHHFEATLAKLEEHQAGHDKALSDHETRIRYLESARSPGSSPSARSP